MGFGLPGPMGYGDNGVSGVQSTTGQMKEDLTSTLRSMRDSLSTSLQTLNLTMSGIHNQLRTMSSNFNPAATATKSPWGFPGTNIPTFPISSNLGSMSGAMGAHIANNSMYGLAMGNKPFNVGGYEYAYERQKEMQNRITMFGTDVGIGMGSVMGMGAGTSAIMKMAGLGKFGLAASLPIGFGLSYALSPITDRLSNGAQDFMRGSSAIQRLSPRFGSEFTMGQSMQAQQGVNRMYSNEIANRSFMSTNLGRSGLQEVMNQGLSMNLFQGNNPEKLVKQMEQAAGVVKFLTGVLGSKDVSETMRYVGQMKNMGINLAQNGNFAQTLGLAAHKYGASMGVPGAELLNQATQIGAQAYGQYGMPSFGGIMPAMKNMALANELEKRRFLSTAEIAGAGGHNAIASQMVGATAGMMANPAIGGMMLASGWQGGGNFSMNKMNGALASGGYWGAMSQGVGALAGDPKKFASYMMNKENLYASAAKQGGLDTQTENMLFAALDNQYGMEDDNVAGMFIMQIMQQQGTPISTAAAKMLVAKHRQPGLMKMFTSQVDKARDRGFYAANKANNGYFRPIGRFVEGIENTITGVGAGIENLGGTIAQGVQKLTGEADNHGYGNSVTGIFNSKQLEAYAGMNHGGSLIGTNVDQAAFARASKGMRYNTSGFLGTTGDPLSLTIRNRSEVMSTGAIIGGVNARNNKGYWDELTHGKMGEGEAMARLRDLGYDSRQYIGSNLQGTDGTGITTALADRMSAGAIASLASGTTGEGWYRNMSEEQAKSYANSILGDSSGMSKDAMLTQLLGNTDKLGSVSRGIGVSDRRAAFALANKLGSGTMSNAGMINGATDEKWSNWQGSTAAIAKARGLTQGSEIFGPQGENGLTFSSGAMTASLHALGLSQDDMTAISSRGAEGNTAMDAYSKALDQIAKGENVGSDTFDKLKGFDSLKDSLDKMLAGGNGKYNLNRAIGNDSILGFGKRKNDDSIGSGVKSLYERSAGEDIALNAQKGLREGFGFNFDLNTMKSKMATGDLADLVMGGATDNKAGQVLQGKLRGVGNMSRDELLEEYGKLKPGVNAKNIDSAEMQKVIRNSMMTTDFSAQQDATAEADVPKSKIDLAVSEAGGASKYVVNVQIATAQVDKTADAARGQTATGTGSNTGKTNSGAIGGNGYAKMALPADTGYGK